MEEFSDNVFPLLKEKFHSLTIDERGNDFLKQIICLRANFCTEDEVNEFVDEFKKLTRTSWMIYALLKAPTRKVYHKTWICQHSSYKKERGSQRDAMCEAKIDIQIKKVNRGTIKNDVYLKQMPPLPCVIKLHVCHTHNTNTAESLKMLRVSDKTRNEFHEYFSMHLGPTEAKRFHESKLLAQKEVTYEILADASQNPTLRQIAHLHDQWRQRNLGTLANALEVLKSKVDIYAEKGTTVKLQEDTPWCVIVATPVMKRLQQLPWANEIVFVDSTSSCESTKSVLTVLLAATTAGAIPLAVVIHECQTTENYKNAFQLLKDSFPLMFGGKEAPAVFMTDDCQAEKAALSAVWPSAQQLLCHFHVAQAEWRWLHSSGKVPSSERKKLMKLFQAVMYADSAESLGAAVKKIFDECHAYPEFVHRFQRFFQRRKEWLLYDRRTVLTRNHNTNNFAEATVRILKDIILHRTKAFNVTALTEFCVIFWEEYLQKKLLEYAYDRRSSPRDSYMKLASKMSHSDVKVTEQSDGCFLVESDTSPGVQYIVDMTIGVCTCSTGKNGALCKHQHHLHMHLNVPAPNAPPVTPHQRYLLAVLAVGEKRPPPSFFGGFLTRDCLENMDIPFNLERSEVIANENAGASTSGALSSDAERKELATKMCQLLEKDTPRNLVVTLTKQIDEAINSGKQVQTLQLFSLMLKSKARSGKKIKVQPTSLCRRRAGMPRGAKRVPAGRPSCARASKRPRNLSLNIDKNLPNAKSHSST